MAGHMGSDVKHLLLLLRERVAQMPDYSASSPTTADSGGSAVAVLKGCSDVSAALKFANWLDMLTRGRMHELLFRLVERYRPLGR